MKTWKLILAIALASVLWAGCSSTNVAPWKPLVAQTSVAETVTVIPAQVSTVTNGTNVITTVVPESYQTNYATNILYTVNPATTSTLSTVRGLNNTLNPTPTAPLIELGLGLLSVGLGVFARFKTKQAQKNGDLLHTVIAGVEAANVPEVKEKISEVAALLKRDKALNKVVQEQTQ